jgi:hypothetical protein
MKGFGSHLLGMGSKVYLIEHFDADELYHRYREEQDPIKRTHLQKAILPFKFSSFSEAVCVRQAKLARSSRWNG